MKNDIQKDKIIDVIEINEKCLQFLVYQNIDVNIEDFYHGCTGFINGLLLSDILSEEEFKKYISRLNRILNKDFDFPVKERLL